jgi:sugar lactone lactonase YvrE
MTSQGLSIFRGTANRRASLPFIFLVGGVCIAFAIRGNAQPYTFTTIAGLSGAQGSDNGTNSMARFYRPSGLAVDKAGNIYVADLLNYTIRKVAPVGTNWVVSTLAGLAGTLGSNDGTNDQARFDHPSGVAVDNAGNLFVTDSFSQTIRKITPVGTNWVVSTIAGLAYARGSDDGTNSDARFATPEAVAVDNTGTVYVTDRVNCTIRAITAVGTNWVVTTAAGTPVPAYGGFADGTNGDAAFNLPFGIARDKGGNLYVADFGNNAIRRISSDGPDWVTSTITGFSGKAGTNDGPATQAMFYSPNGIAVDASGVLYVADQYNNSIRTIAPVGSSWTVSTVGGRGPLAVGTNDGVGASALFSKPWGIALDTAGNVYVADSSNNTIRKGASSVPLPSLQIVMVANQTVLSWPVAGGTYALETAFAIGPGAPWVPVTSGVAVTGSSYFFTNNAGANRGFFRLRHQ